MSSLSFIMIPGGGQGYVLSLFTERRREKNPTSTIPVFNSIVLHVYQVGKYVRTYMPQNQLQLKEKSRGGGFHSGASWN